VLQRNDSGSPMVLPTLQPPVEVPPGGVIDHDKPITGFMPVDPPSAADSDAAPEPKPKPGRPAKAAATTDAEEATK